MVYICERNRFEGSIMSWRRLDEELRRVVAGADAAIRDLDGRRRRRAGEIADLRRRAESMREEVRRLRSDPRPSREDLRRAADATDHDLIGVGQIPRPVREHEARLERASRLEEDLEGTVHHDALEDDDEGAPGILGRIEDLEARQDRDALPNHVYGLSQWADRLPGTDASPGYYLEDGRRFESHHEAERADHRASPDPRQQARNEAERAASAARDRAARDHPLARIFESDLALRGQMIPGVRLVCSLGEEAEVETTGRRKGDLIEVRFLTGWRRDTALHLGLPYFREQNS